MKKTDPAYINRALELYSQGFKKQEVAREFGLHINGEAYWRKNWKEYSDAVNKGIEAWTEKIEEIRLRHKKREISASEGARIAKMSKSAFVYGR